MVVIHGNGSVDMTTHQIAEDAKAQHSGADEVDVSVLLVTYNHANYVEAAIRSVLDQQTPRSFELIISEDASTDGTREIVRRAATKDSRIRTLFSAENLRSNEPVLRALTAARGRYVCLLDGDDRWLVRDKIERQAALLDANPRATGCFHNALVVVGDGDEPTDRRWTPPAQSPRTTIGDLWEGNPFATSAGMLRRSALERVGPWYVDCFPITDWPLYLLAAEHGDLLFVDEPVAAYRVHSGGEVSGLERKEQLQLIARFYRRMAAVDGGSWADLARSGASLYFAGQAGSFIREGDKATARRCTRLALQAGGVGQSVPWRMWLRLVRGSFV
jgi:glycosyltransferase involved in cell wall biosynthesis